MTEAKVGGYLPGILSHFGADPAPGINQSRGLFSFASVWNSLHVRSSYFEDYNLYCSCSIVFWSCRTGQQVYRSWLENARWHHCCRFLTQQRHRCVSQRGGCCFSYSRFRDCLAWKTEQGGNFHFEQKNSFNRACMPVPFHVRPFPQHSQTKCSTHQTDGGKRKKKKKEICCQMPFSSFYLHFLASCRKTGGCSKDLAQLRGIFSSPVKAFCRVPLVSPYLGELPVTATLGQPVGA